jgi:hypothetical protein
MAVYLLYNIFIIAVLSSCSCLILLLFLPYFAPVLALFCSCSCLILLLFLPYFALVLALFCSCSCLILLLFLPYFALVLALFCSCSCLILLLFLPYFAPVLALFCSCSCLIFCEKKSVSLLQNKDTVTYLAVFGLSRDYCTDFLRYTGNSRKRVYEVNFYKHLLPCLSDCAKFFGIHRSNVDRC